MSISVLGKRAAEAIKPVAEKKAAVKGRKITRIFLHCTAGTQTQTVASILNYWKTLGWITPGYHFLIEPNGTIHNLVPIETPSNGVGGYNANSLHISYIGGVSTKESHPLNAPGTPVDNRTPQQKEAQKRLVMKYSTMFPNAVILGHRDISPDKNRNGIIESHEWVKACPSFSVKDWLSEIGFKSPLPLTILRATANVNLREGSGTEFKLLQVIPYNTLVKKLAAVKEWTYIEIVGTDVKGWVSTKYLK